MKPLSLLLGLGLAGAGLAAPSAAPYQVTVDDGILLVRTRVVRVDMAAMVHAAPSSVEVLTTNFLKHVSGALELLRSHEHNRPVAPVFALDPNRAEAMTDNNGDLVTISDGSRARKINWNQSTWALPLYPMTSFQQHLPLIIIAISASIIAVCLYLERSAPSRESLTAFDLASAEKGLAPTWQLPQGQGSTTDKAVSLDS